MCDMIEKNKVKSGLISTLVKIDNRVNLLQEHICSCSRFTRLSILTKVEINPLFTLFFSIISHNYAPVNTKIKKSLINFKNFFTFLENQNLFPPFICNIVLYTA